MKILATFNYGNTLLVISHAKFFFLSQIILWTFGWLVWFSLWTFRWLVWFSLFAYFLQWRFDFLVDNRLYFVPEVPTNYLKHWMITRPRTDKDFFFILHDFKFICLSDFDSLVSRRIPASQDGYLSKCIIIRICLRSYNTLNTFQTYHTLLLLSKHRITSAVCSLFNRMQTRRRNGLRYKINMHCTVQEW